MSNTVYQIQQLILNPYQSLEDTIIRRDIIKDGKSAHNFSSNITSTQNLAESNSCSNSPIEPLL